MFICKCCKYETSKKNHYERHLISRSHEIRSSNVDSEMATRKKNKKLKETTIEKKLDNIDKKIDEKFAKMDKKITNVSKGIKKITDSIEFLNIYCSNAKPLAKLTDDEMNKILKLDPTDKPAYEKQQEKLVRLFRKKKLHLYIAESLSEYYLFDDDPTIQQLWCTDASRSHYASIKSSPDGKTKTWVRDKKGILFG